MTLTDKALKCILDIMEAKGLDPENIFFEVSVVNSNLQISFTNEAIGQTIKFGKLKVKVDPIVQTRKLVIDYQEIGQKRGLIFTE